MKKPDFENIYNDFTIKLTEIGKMPNQIDMMREMLKLPMFFEETWNDGYLQGIKEGKKQAFNIKKN